jgi:drug/metabolite transporter (DMT)-like permease
MPTLANLAGIGMIGPARAAILMLFEAVVAVTAAAILLSQRPEPIQVLGGVAVLLSGALLQLPRRGERLVVEAVHPGV